MQTLVKLWTAYLDKEITAHDAAVMLALLKVARTKFGEPTEDTYVDAAAYMAIAGECKHEDKEWKRKRMKIPLFKPQTEWIPPTDFPDLGKYDEIAVDLETKDPNLNERMGSGSVVGVGDVVGISLATHDWCAYYPIAHEGGGNMDRKMVLKMVSRPDEHRLNKNISQCNVRCMLVKKIRHIKYKVKIVDTMIAASLVDENRFRYDLNGLSRDYLGKGKDETALYEAAKSWGVDPKAEMYKLPAMYVGAYAERDAQLTLELWQELKKEILHQDIEDIFDMETKLCFLFLLT